MSDLYLKKGYVLGCKQPVIEANLTLRCTQQINLQEIDQVLIEKFGLLAEFLKLEEVTCQYKALAERLLYLAGSLHRYSGIPAFDFGQVITTNTEPADNETIKIRIHCLVPHLSFINSQHRSHLYQAASNIMQDLIFAKHADLNHRLERVHQQLLLPIKKAYGNVDSKVPILDSAHQNNIPFMHIAKNVYQLGWGACSRLVNSSSTDGDSAIGANLSCNKADTSALLRSAQLPTPLNYIVANEQDLLRKAKQIGFPVVVKPTNLERSEGVSTNIQDEVTLLQAYKDALKLSKQIMVEEHLQGFVHRVAIVGDELLYVSKRMPKSVKGDGMKTVEQLIDLANLNENKKAPWRRLKPFLKDALAVKSMNNAGYQLDSIPDKDCYVPLRPIGGVAEGGVVDICTDIIHPQNIQLAQRVRKLFRLSAIGLDLLTEDITVPWYENGGKINEINFSPHVGNAAIPYAEEYHKKYLSALGVLHNHLEIHVFIGDDKAWQAAKQFHLTKIQHTKAFITNHQITLDEKRHEYISTGKNFYDNCQSLLRNREVELLITVIQTDDFMESGLPFRSVQQVHLVNNNITLKYCEKENKPALIDLLTKTLQADNV